jgi:N-acetylneuraminic acid mutarotase
MKIKKHKNKLLFFSAFLIIVNLLTATIAISADCVPILYPAARAGHAMSYDSVNDLVILFGGQTGSGPSYRRTDTWSYDYNNNEWINLAPTIKPNASSWLEMAYDSESEKLILFGGAPQVGNTLAETWIYDYSTNLWTLANPNDSPDVRITHVMAYDSESDVVIMHGGSVDAAYNPAGLDIHYNDTWAYDYNTNTWTEMSPTGLAIGLDEAQMTYDSESDRVILVGGYFIDPYANPLEEYYATETWAYDYNSDTWENVTTTIHPTHRMDHALAYDSESDRVILVGGHIIPADYTVEDETWAFDYNTQTWENMNPTNQPVRLAHQMAYDEESDLVILFGGLNSTSYSIFYNEIYTYDYNTNNWTLMPQIYCPEDTNFIFVLPMISLFSILAVIVILRRRK